MPAQTRQGWNVLAIGAHPDDIEFGMAGTLLQLQAAGAEIHVWSLADGACGTVDLPPQEIARIRAQEAASSAQLAGAHIHLPITTDLEIFYEKNLIAQVAAVIREVQPVILLIPSLQDYMEDHINTARLAVTAAFARRMRNFQTFPEAAVWEDDMAIYHAMPHGGCDVYGRFVAPQRFVDISPVMNRKTEMLAQHTSQYTWLRQSQALDSYLQAMIDFGAALGRVSEKFSFAEGWRPHNYLGFASQPGFDPMKNFLECICCDNPLWKSFEPDQIE
jgi:N-acetylglucosamine malate deacetylase 1